MSKFIISNNEYGYELVDASKLPIDIVVNGFSIKETILEVLREYEIKDEIRFLACWTSEQLAEDIKEAFAVKLNLRQG